MKTAAKPIVSNRGHKITHNTLVRLNSRLTAAGISKAVKAKGILSAIKKYGMPAEPKKRSQIRAKWEQVPFADSEMAATAQIESKGRNPRKQNWRYSLPCVSAYYTTGFEVFRYKGRHSGRQGSYGIPQYPSYVEIAKSSGAVAKLFQNGTLIATRWAPKGMRWSHDENGVFVVDEKGRDYHPTADEFRAKNFMRIIRDAITTKKKAETKIAKQAKANLMIDAILKTRKRLAKYWVSREDSTAAGNCGTGTDRFIETVARIMGDGIGAIRADVLIEKWPSYAVEKAVRVAIARLI